MQTACALAAEHGAAITAVSVIEVSPLLPLDARMTEEEETSREALARAQAISNAFGVTVRPRTIRARDGGRAIVDLVEDEEAELVVIGAPPERRELRRGPVFGGAIRHVLTKAPCRVLVVADPASSPLSSRPQFGSPAPRGDARRRLPDPRSAPVRARFANDR